MQLKNVVTQEQKLKSGKYGESRGIQENSQEASKVSPLKVGFVVYRHILLIHVGTFCFFLFDALSWFLDLEAHLDRFCLADILFTGLRPAADSFTWVVWFVPFLHLLVAPFVPFIPFVLGFADPL